MKKLAALVIGGGLLAITTLSAFTSSTSNFTCQGPTRNEMLCNTMHHLRAQVHLLGEQRDLMQFNYEFLESVASDMEQTVEALLTEMKSPAHLEGLNGVTKMAIELGTLANAKTPLAFNKANQIQNQCLACHTAGAGSAAGFEWERISRVNWAYITDTCNQTFDGRVPYRCKSMYGMLKMVDYFWTSLPKLPTKELNFSTIATAGVELARIAKDLKAKKLGHQPQQRNPIISAEPTILESDELFDHIIVQAQELVALAKVKSPLVRDKIKTMASACMNCHGVQF